MHKLHGLITIAILASAASSQSLHRYDYPIDTSMSLDQLVTELRDDDVTRNAQTAINIIMNYPTSPVDRLFEALDDPDWQTRQIACDLLWNIRSSHDPIVSNNDMFRTTNLRWKTKDTDPTWRHTELPFITDRLIVVTIEGLRNDVTPYERSKNRALMYSNAVHGMYRMIPIAHQWRAELETAMESDDPQQQLAAAIILARAGVTQSIERASQILLPHLRDNDIAEDAKFCIWALAGFGKDLLPIMNAALPDADEQQRNCIMLLSLNLVNPTITTAQRIERANYNSITKNVHDPVAESPKADTWSWLNKLYH